MANYSRWDDSENKRRPSADEKRDAGAGFARSAVLRPEHRSRAQPARVGERMGTTQSVFSRARKVAWPGTGSTPLPEWATALDRHLVVSFPEMLPAKLKDAVQVA